MVMMTLDDDDHATQGDATVEGQRKATGGKKGRKWKVHTLQARFDTVLAFGREVFKNGNLTVAKFVDDYNKKNRETGYTLSENSFYKWKREFFVKGQQIFNAKHQQRTDKAADAALRKEMRETQAMALEVGKSVKTGVATGDLPEPSVKPRRYNPIPGRPSFDPRATFYGVRSAAAELIKPLKAVMEAIGKLGIKGENSKYSQCPHCRNCIKKSGCDIPKRCHKCKRCKDRRSKKCRRLLLRFTSEELAKIKKKTDDIISGPEAREKLDFTFPQRHQFYYFLNGIIDMATPGHPDYIHTLTSDYPDVTKYLLNYRAKKSGKSHWFTLKMFVELMFIKERYFSDIGLQGNYREIVGKYNATRENAKSLGIKMGANPFDRKPRHLPPNYRQDLNDKIEIDEEYEEI